MSDESTAVENGGKKKKGRKVQIIILVIVCLLLAGLCLGGYYLYRQATSGLFFAETKINGYDVSEKTCEEVEQMLAKDYSAPVITLTEDGQTALTMTLADMGYTIDEKALLKNVRTCMSEQNKRLIFSLYEGNTFEVKIPFVYDEAVFDAEVSAVNLANARVASTDATLEYDGEEYYIEPETYGNEIDDRDLQVLVRDYVDKLVASDRPQDDAEIALPASFYFLPDVTVDDSELNFLMDTYNSYCKANVVLTFGEKTKEKLNWDTIQDWLIIDVDEESCELNEEAVYEYVENLAAKYDTLYMARTFETTGGGTVSFESGDYGYQIDQDAEFDQLMEDIKANKKTKREPIYSNKGLRREGLDDVCGTYVEVSLTAQHLWYYKDGELLIESDMVSGMPTAERETATGVFTIPYKEMNVTLTGGTGSGAYSTPVTYWMPFYDGQGLHDASWRSSFGGSIYQTNGSHGCVNLPYSIAEAIYAEMEERTLIFLYK